MKASELNVNKQSHIQRYKIVKESIQNTGNVYV
jgi:hypothetical protein